MNHTIAHKNHFTNKATEYVSHLVYQGHFLENNEIFVSYVRTLYSASQQYKYTFLQNLFISKVIREDLPQLKTNKDSATQTC